MSQINRKVLPGFYPTLTYAIGYMAVLVLLPLGACFLRASTLSPSEFTAAVWTARARAAYGLTFGASFTAALLSMVLGLLVAWVLVRYEFPFKRLFDSLIDLPFALPTAVAGLVYSSLYVDTGWFGRLLAPLAFDVGPFHLLGLQFGPFHFPPAAYTREGIVLVLVFIGLPFVVRTVQPVLETVDKEIEEAAECLGASRWQTFWRVILPTLFPALITGFALSFARALGEYGSVVFMSGNKQYLTEIAPTLIVSKLEELSERANAEATAIAVVLLVASLGMLVLINLLERWSKRTYA